MVKREGRVSDGGGRREREGQWRDDESFREGKEGVGERGKGHA